MVFACMSETAPRAFLMSAKAQLYVKRPRPLPYDHCLRYWVWSRTAPGKKYLVQLDAHLVGGVFMGLCTCKQFACRLEPLIRRGVTPAEAVEKGLVKLAKGQSVENVLRCTHIIDAFMTFSEDTTKAVHDAEQAHIPQAYREP